MMVRRMGSRVYSQALSFFSDTTVTEEGSTSEEEGVEKEDGHPGKTYPGEKTGSLRKKLITKILGTSSNGICKSWPVFCKSYILHVPTNLTNLDLSVY